MSEGRLEARREARRAESPPDTRDRRRRRLNSSHPSNLSQSTELVSSWLEQQQDLTRSAVSTQTLPSTDLRSWLSTSVRENDHSEQEVSQSVVAMWDRDNSVRAIDVGPSSMWDQDTSVRAIDTGPSAAYHPPAIDIDADDRSTSAPFGDRSFSSRRNGPLLNLVQIVSKNQPASARADSQASSAADSDDLLSVTSEDSQDIAVLRSFPALVPQQAPRHLWDVRNFVEQMAGTERRAAKKSTYPENPALLLVYQLDRNTPEPTLRYLPFIPVSQKRNTKSKNKNFMIQPSHKQRIDVSQLTARRAQWVPGEFPVELFELINQHLCRDDIKSMRLVSKEFERGVSGSLFDTVVVPFNTELYEMIEQKVAKTDLKGKRRADDPVNNFVNLDPGSLLWENALQDSDGKVYRGHGLKVFEGFGHHIRRFGMSFEIKEEALQSPPRKNKLDSHESYFGSYEWPSREYTRYELLAGLERTADETSQMKLAFSHLPRVQQLALSMDSGLGWMSGPDKSLRSTILQQPSPVFGCSHGIVDAQQQERIRLWESIESAYARLGALDELKEGSLERANLDENFFHRLPFSTTPYASPAVWATTPAHLVSTTTSGASDSNDYEAPETGVLYISSPDTHDYAFPSLETQRQECSRKIEKFSPASLGTHQKEWLLEAEWAQRAFLTTYMLGVVDNSSVFDKVSSLNFRMSSHLVPLLSRHDFWTALPKLQEVTLSVIPDWRTVERDEAGVVETKDVEPSVAIEKTYALLQEFIGVRPNITKLKFSWAAGGEHAEGIFARNHHVLPAPITTIARSTAVTLKDDDLINLPHISELTFSNCWFTPVSIVAMVKKLRKGSLKKIKFDSVSLTAMPRAAGVLNNQVNLNQNVVAPVPAPPQAPGPGPGMMLGGNFSAQFSAQVWQGPPPHVPVRQWAQTMLATLNALTQQQGLVLFQVPQIWTNHPMGLTMQQIHGMLTLLAAGHGQGGGPAMAQPGMLYHLPQQQQQGGAAQFPPPAALAAPPVPFGGWVHPLQQAGQAAPAPPPHNGPWYEGHRAGSWVTVIDRISPGPRLEMYTPRDEFEPMPMRHKKGLDAAEFLSCGYVQLRSPSFGDQNNIEAHGSYRPSRHFIRRQNLLAPAMLTTTDKLVGTIVQYMSEHETDALHHAWGMNMGWSDAKLAEEAEYDGYLAGGTGRFSGSVTKDSVIQEAYSAHHS